MNVEKLRSELAIAIMESEISELKKSNSSSEYTELAERLRESRRVHRLSFPAAQSGDETVINAPAVTAVTKLAQEG